MSAIALGAPVVEVTDLHKSFGSNHVLRGLDATIHQGEVVCVIGPSGSGKSTFLRCINLLEQPTSGSIKVDGEEVTDPDCDIDAIRRNMGMVFQQFNLFPHLSVLENCTIAQTTVLKRRRDEAEAMARENLEKVGLSEKEEAFPAQLSGGQQQRVAIARALVTRPEVMFADEPTGALDSRTGGEILGLMRESVDRHSLSIVMVTHDPLAAARADSVLFLADGRIVDHLVAPTADSVADRMTHLEG